MKKVVIGLKVLLAVCLMGVISAVLSGCGNSGTTNSNITNSSASTTNSAAQTTTTSAANIGNSSVSAVPTVSSVQAGGTFDVNIVVNTSIRPGGFSLFSIGIQPKYNVFQPNLAIISAILGGK